MVRRNRGENEAQRRTKKKGSKSDVTLTLLDVFVNCSAQVQFGYSNCRSIICVFTPWSYIGLCVNNKEDAKNIILNSKKKHATYLNARIVVH